MLAWHNDPALKEQTVARMRKHREEDSIVQGLYQTVAPDLAEGYKGCWIGCTLPRLSEQPRIGWHAEAELRFGVPLVLWYLGEHVFEKLPTEDNEHADFAVASLEAIPVGADLELAGPGLMLDLLADPTLGVRRHVEDERWLVQRDAIDTVVGLYRRRLAGETVTDEEWAAAGAAGAAWAAWAAGDAGDEHTRWLRDRWLHHVNTAPIPANV